MEHGSSGRTRLELQVITPLHVLDETHATGFLVAPGGRTPGTVLEGTDGLVPFPAAVDEVAFKVVATGESEEFLCY